jgi:drug/metabolite transporter (DMT)-like permease
MGVWSGVQRLGQPDATYARGVVLTLVTAIAWSSTGLVFRYVEDASAWQILFFRALALSAALAIVLVLRSGRNTARAVVAVGWPGVIAAVFLGLGSVFFIFAIQHTTIANVAFLTSSTPFLAAIAAWLVLRERVSRATGVSILIAMAGVAVMVAEGFAVGGWFGNLMALGCATVSAGYVVALRYGRHADLSPCVFLSGLVAMAIAVPFVGDFAITWHDLALCATQGMLISAVCNVVFTYCARWVPAGELTLLGMFEAVLSPTWVWLLLGEVPTAWTLAGGAIVLAAVAGQAAAAFRRRPAAP